MYIPLVKSKKITGEMLFMCDNVKDLNQLGITVDVHAKLLLKTFKRFSGKIFIS